MNYNEIIHILIILIFGVFLFLSNLLLILYSNKSIYIFKKKPFLLLFVTLSLIIIWSLQLLKNSFGEKIHYLIYFNLYTIFMSTSVTIYTYRGIYIYLKHKYDKEFFLKILIYRIIIILLNIISFIYIIYININYYNNRFGFDDWQYYPILIIYFIYLIVIHPLLIIFLNKIEKNDIRNDYIFSMVVLTLGFIFELLDLSKLNIFEFYEYQIIKNYIHFLTGVLICSFYNLLPLLKVIFKKYIKKEKDVYIEKTYLNYIDENIKNNIDKNQNIDKIYLDIYKKINEKSNA